VKHPERSHARAESKQEKGGVLKFKSIFQSGGDSEDPPVGQTRRKKVDADVLFRQSDFYSAPLTWHNREQREAGHPLPPEARWTRWTSAPPSDSIGKRTKVAPDFCPSCPAGANEQVRGCGGTENDAKMIIRFRLPRPGHPKMHIRRYTSEDAHPKVHIRRSTSFPKMDVRKSTSFPKLDVRRCTSNRKRTSEEAHPFRKWTSEAAHPFRKWTCEDAHPFRNWTSEDAHPFR
jgi:hypothetical protein